MIEPDFLNVDAGISGHLRERLFLDAIGGMNGGQ